MALRSAPPVPSCRAPSNEYCTEQPKRAPSPTYSTICSPRWPAQMTMSVISWRASNRSWWATSGSPATSTSDFGTVSVNGCNRVANPPASRASAGMRSDEPSAGLLDQRQQRHPQRLAAAVTAAPAETANALGVEPHDRDIALPAAVATGVVEARLYRQLQAFHGEFGYLGDGDVVAGRDIVGVEIPGRIAPSVQYRSDNIGHVNIGFALTAVAHDREAGGVDEQSPDEIEADPVGLSRADDIGK